PRLYGVLSEAGYDLVQVSEFLPGGRDGWELATAACRDGESLGDELRLLGVALRQVHESLAAAFGTAPLPIAELRDEFRSRLAAASAVPELATLAPRLGPAVELAGDGAVQTQRVHGDFHLGQALWCGDGWRLIDFEGEPGAPLARRRAFDSRWRDVAGLLRSLDYARSAHPDPAGASARAWSEAAREAFLQGYGEDVADPVLLRAYEVDRMVYEVGYELRNRPDWVGIPLAAVEDEARRT
ncbi:MAG: phosphotransferase, partial [Propionicimonas sp.]